MIHFQSKSRFNPPNTSHHTDFNIRVSFAAFKPLQGMTTSQPSFSVLPLDLPAR